MLTWQQIREGLNSILKDDELLYAVHIAAGKDRLEIVRDDEREGTIIRTPVLPKEQKA